MQIAFGADSILLLGLSSPSRVRSKFLFGLKFRGKIVKIWLPCVGVGTLFVSFVLTGQAKIDTSASDEINDVPSLKKAVATVVEHVKGSWWKSSAVAELMDIADRVFVPKNKPELTRLFASTEPGTLQDFFFHAALLRSGSIDLIKIAARDPVMPKKSLEKGEAGYRASLYALKTLLNADEPSKEYNFDRMKALFGAQQSNDFIASKGPDFLGVIIESVYGIPESAYKESSEKVAAKLELLGEFATLVIDSYDTDIKELKKEFASATLIPLTTKFGYVKEKTLNQIQKYLDKKLEPKKVVKKAAK